MDTVTYPDPDLQETLKRFVCARVSVDDRKDLAARYGVTPLPDIRFLDTDGRELHRLLGFQSAVKLKRQCTAVLEGRVSAVSPEAKANGKAAAPPPASAEAVDGAVRKAAAWLCGSAGAGW